MTLRELHEIVVAHLDRWGDSEVELCASITKPTEPITGLWFPEPPSDGPVQVESVVWTTRDKEKV
jgi:hypothetical protein